MALFSINLWYKQSIVSDMNRIPCLFMLGSIYSNYLGRKCRDGEIGLHTNLLLKLSSLLSAFK